MQGDAANCMCSSARMRPKLGDLQIEAALDTLRRDRAAFGVEQMRGAATVRRAKAGNWDRNAWRHQQFQRPFMFGGAPGRRMPDRTKDCDAAQKVNVPVRPCDGPQVMRQPALQSARSPGAAHIPVPARGERETPHLPHRNAGGGIQRQVKEVHSRVSWKRTCVGHPQDTSEESASCHPRWNASGSSQSSGAQG